MTPYFVEVFLTIHTRGVPLCQRYPRSDVLSDILIQMINDDLIEDIDKRPLNDRGNWFMDQIQNTSFQLTDRGQKFLDMILETPFPVQHTEWLDPREIR